MIYDYKTYYSRISLSLFQGIDVVLISDLVGFCQLDNL